MPAHKSVNEGLGSLTVSAPVGAEHHEGGAGKGIDRMPLGCVGGIGCWRLHVGFHMNLNLSRCPSRHSAGGDTGLRCDESLQDVLMPRRPLCDVLCAVPPG